MAKSEKKKSVLDEFKSPARKLVPFFVDSRDKWKAKCQKAKYQAKLLKNRIRHLDKRKAELKQKVKVLEKELKQAKHREHKLANEIEHIKKTRMDG